MEPGSPWLLVIIILLICCSALFSASETALISLNRIRMRQMEEDGVKGAGRVLKLTENTQKLLSSILVGNNIVNILASSIATSVAVMLSGNGVLIATIAMTLLILIFGEVMPKTYATKNPENVSLKVSGIISVVVIICTPLVWVLNGLTSLFLKAIGKTDEDKPSITEAELKLLLNVSTEEGVLEANEQEMLSRVFDFGDQKAKDVMTPRTDLYAIELEADYNSVVELFKNERFSRIPVYGEDIDDIVGILHFKDIAFIDPDKFSIADYMHEPFFTYESKRVVELFSQMRTEIIPMAVVLDEYGGTSGILTMEDMIEEVMGEIADEFGEDIEDIRKLKDNVFIVEGVAKIDDVNEMLGTRLESEDFDTIGGYVTGILGRFPDTGEIVNQDSLKFIITEADKNRIVRLKIVKINKKES